MVSVYSIVHRDGTVNACICVMCACCVCCGSEVLEADAVRAPV